MIRKFGAVLEDELPWSGRLAAGSPEAYYASAKRRRIMAYFNLGDDSATDRTAHFDEWRRWMHQNGPVLVLVALDGKLETPGATLDVFDTESRRTGSHAAALFGYGPDHFLLRSSWGPSWRRRRLCAHEPRVHRASGDRELRRDALTGDGLSLVGDPRRDAREAELTREQRGRG